MEEKRNDYNEKELQEKFLNYIEYVEKNPENRKQLRNQSTNIDLDRDTDNLLRLLLSLFKNKTAGNNLRDKINFILEYNEDYDMEKLLSFLDIDFIQFNSLISNNADEPVLRKTEEKLNNIITNMRDYDEDSEVEMNLRSSSNLDKEAEDFSERLFNNIYNNNNNE